MKKMIGPAVVLMLCGTLLYWGIPRIIRVLIGRPIVIVHCDMALASSMQKNIESRCKQQFSPLNSAWMDTLRQQFPMIGRITSTRENNMVLIHIETVPFVARVNNQCVIDRTGTMHTLKHINSETSATLKNITAQIKLHEINNEFKQFIQTLPPEILEKYVIDWHSPYLIYLMPTAVPYHFITRYDLITDIQKLTQAECLAQLPQHAKKTSILDMRFSKQIIINTTRKHE